MEAAAAFSVANLGLLTFPLPPSVPPERATGAGPQAVLQGGA